MYRWLLRPKWMLSHLFVATLAVVMIGLGFWQLDRLDQRREANASIEERTELVPAAVTDLVEATDPVAVGDDLDYRSALAVGRYRGDAQVLIRNRTFEGRPGYWVMTPLVLTTGEPGTDRPDEALLVNRGWVPFVAGEEVDRPPAPPAGEVTVSGVLRKTQTASGLQNADPAEGTLDVLSRPDLERLRQQTDVPLYPVYLQSLADGPDGLPVAVALPEPSEGPHLSYAVQWFIFATIALGGYLLFLRKHARDLAAATSPRRTRRPAAPAWHDA